MNKKTPSPVTSPTSLIPGSGSVGIRVPLQKSPTSAGVIPGGVSTCFMASKKQQQQPPPPQLSFINNKASENFTSINPFQQQKQQQQQQKFHNHNNTSSNIPRIQQSNQQLNHQQSFQQQLQQQRDAIERKLGATIAGIKAAQVINPPQYHINGQIIHPGNGNGNTNNNASGGGVRAPVSPADNNNNNSTRTSSPNTAAHNTSTNTPPTSLSRTSSGSNSPNSHMLPQGLRKSATSIGVPNHHHQFSPSKIHGNVNHLMHSNGRGGIIMPGRGVNDSSGESDTDLEFLKQIDFETIDGQELQELLSSF